MISLVQQLISLIAALLLSLLSGWYGYTWITSARAQRKTFFLLTLIPVIAALSYWGMYFGMIMLELETRTHELFRYFDWIITTPIIVFLVLSVAYGSNLKHHKETVFAAIIFDVIMIVSGLFAALESGWTRWVWFLISSLAFLFVLYILLFHANRAVVNDTEGKKSLLSSLNWLIIIIWSFYPFVWLLSPAVLGFFDMEAETLLFAILDLVAKGVFGALLIYNKEVIFSSSNKDKL